MRKIEKTDWMGKWKYWNNKKEYQINKKNKNSSKVIIGWAI
jgi:hypothetical protein